MNSELKEFIEYVELEMSKFLKEGWLHLTVKERVAIENLVIAYDQMVDRLDRPSTPTGGIKSTEERFEVHIKDITNEEFIIIVRADFFGYDEETEKYACDLIQKLNEKSN